MFHDSTNAERHIGVNLAAQPEYKKFRSLARQIAKYNDPPFVVVRGEHRDTQADCDQAAGVRQGGRQAGRLGAALQGAWAK